MAALALATIGLAGCGSARFVVPGEAQRRTDWRFERTEQQAADRAARDCEPSPPYYCPLP